MNKLVTAWDFRFYNLVEECLIDMKLWKFIAERGEKIYEFIGIFQRKAKDLARSIIEEYVYPPYARSYVPEVNSEQNDYENHRDNELTYYLREENIWIKITWLEKLKKAKFELNSSHSDVKQKRSGSRKWKSYGHGNEIKLIFLFFRIIMKISYITNFY